MKIKTSLTPIILTRLLDVALILVIVFTLVNISLLIWTYLHPQHASVIDTLIRYTERFLLISLGWYVGVICSAIIVNHAAKEACSQVPVEKTKLRYMYEEQWSYCEIAMEQFADGIAVLATGITDKFKNDIYPMDFVKNYCGEIILINDDQAFIDLVEASESFTILGFWQRYQLEKVGDFFTTPELRKTAIPVASLMAKIKADKNEEAI